VLVVDDVAGTGDTIAAAVRHVHAAGTRRVRTLVCAVNVLNQRMDRPVLVTHATQATG
jgi:hypoxanthine phosphoribosyltransferase